MRIQIDKYLLTILENPKNPNPKQKSIVFYKENNDIDEIHKTVMKTLMRKIEDKSKDDKTINIRYYDHNDSAWKSKYSHKFSSGLNPSEIMDTIKHDIKDEYGDIFYKRTTHHIMIRNALTREVDAKTYSFCDSRSVEELFDILKEFVDTVLPQRIEQDVVFIDEKTTVNSHRVILLDKNTNKSKSMSISYPYFSSLSILENIVDFNSHAEKCKDTVYLTEELKQEDNLKPLTRYKKQRINKDYNRFFDMDEVTE